MSTESEPHLERVEHVDHLGPYPVLGIAAPDTYPLLRAAWTQFPSRSSSAPIPAADVPAEWRFVDGHCVLGIVAGAVALLLECEAVTWPILRKVHAAAIATGVDRMTVGVFASAQALEQATRAWGPQGDYRWAIALGLFFPLRHEALATL